MAGSRLTVGDVARTLADAYPLDLAAEWDRNGLLAGNPDMPVAGIALALDATVGAVRECVAAGANVLVTHHPAFLDALTEVSPSGSPSAAAVFEAVSAGVALICAHTNLDATVAARESIGSALGLGGGVPLEDATGTSADRFGYLWDLGTPVTVRDVAQRASEAYGDGVVAWGDPGQLVERAVSGTGSGSSLVGVAQSVGAQLLITGEVKYHGAVDAAQSGIAVIEIGHGLSEWPLVSLLGSTVAGVAAAANVPVAVLNPPLSAWTTEKGDH